VPAVPVPDDSASRSGRANAPSDDPPTNTP
jgi:hypothetical protein